MNLKTSRSFKYKTIEEKSPLFMISNKNFKINIKNINKNNNINRTIKIKSQPKKIKSNSKKKLKEQKSKNKKKLKKNIFNNEIIKNNKELLNDIKNKNKIKNKIKIKNKLKDKIKKNEYKEIINKSISEKNSSIKFSFNDSYETISSLKEENLSRNLIKQIREEIDEKYLKSKINKIYKLERDFNGKDNILLNSLESWKNVKIYDLSDQNNNRNLLKNKSLKSKNNKLHINKILKDLLKKMNSNKLIKKNSTTIKLMNKILKKFKEKNNNIKKIKLFGSKFKLFNNNSLIRSNNYLKNTYNDSSINNITAKSIKHYNFNNKNIFKKNDKLIKNLKNNMKFISKSPKIDLSKNKRNWK